ncbi:MAG: hypothetical protein GY913_09070 [Proteobacteria bacterium]|nr:hypothetical protein [Pseudomonadota bacterium]MCP4917062.1 hypothetical protein [Pseudomonadota bacterium]
MRIESLYTEADVLAGRFGRSGPWEIREAVRTRAQIEEALAGGVHGLLIEAPVALADLDLTSVAVSWGGNIDALGIHPASKGGNLGLDPVEGASDEVVAQAEKHGCTAFCIDTAAWHHAGCSDEQDLGLSFRAFVDACRGPVEASVLARHVELRFRLDAELFGGIAKIRAARAMWARVLQVLGIPFVPARIHVRGSRRIWTERDVHTNQLRNAAVVFAGAVGGADSITSAPFDLLDGGTPASRRAARNSQHVLMRESHLGRVFDPAGGSYALESMTRDLAEHAWLELQRLEDGRVDFDHVVDARERALATRKKNVLGVNRFANLDDVGGPGRSSRFASSWEALRTRSDHYLRDHGHRPRVRVVPLGTPAQHTGRLTWLTNLLAAGGLEATSGPSPVCAYAGPDSLYQDLVHESFAVLAGRGDADVELYEGADVLGELERIWRELA